MKNYSNYIQLINNSINNFNNYLKNDKVELLNENVDNTPLYLDLTDPNWWGMPWPKDSNGKGVYFIFGYNKNNDKNLGVYIGKASFQPTSKELNTYLSHQKNKENCSMVDKNSNIFILELTTAINLEKKSIGFFSTALEEFLIIDLQNKIHLLNIQGVKKGTKSLQK